MSKELVISANRHETKVAILEDDLLVEVFFQRANEYSLAGSIHKGRVTRVLPGMQSAFVDWGLERDTFLYVTDFFEDSDEFERVQVNREEPRRDRESRSAEEPRALEEPAAGAEPQAESPAAAGEAAPPPPAVTTPERRDDGDGRDRQGRRSRRRRNRGHGFPEAKYASAESRYVPASRAPRPVEPTHPPEPATSGDFSLLPGQSLAHD